MPNNADNSDNSDEDGDCQDSDSPVLPVVIEQLGEDNDDEGCKDDAHSLEMEIFVSHHLDQLHLHFCRDSHFQSLTLNTFSASSCCHHHHRHCHRSHQNCHYLHCHHQIP